MPNGFSSPDLCNKLSGQRVRLALTRRHPTSKQQTLPDFQPFRHQRRLPPSARVFFNPRCAWLGAVCLALSAVLPPDGLGVALCWFKSLCDLPCPGCGLTRSVTCISHWRLSDALAYHPFGPLIYGLFVANLLILLFPSPWRVALRGRIKVNGFWIRPFCRLTLFAFLRFGVSRLLFSLFCSR